MEVGMSTLRTARPWVLMAVCAWTLAGGAVASTSAGRVLGDVEPKGSLDGIPMHSVSVPTLDHTAAAIHLDGVPDEAVWLDQPVYDNMIVAVPGTGEPGEYRTDMRVFATERGLYVSAVMYQPPETLVRRMTNRDQFIDRDTFGFTLDATGTGVFAYWFIVALGDSLMDGKVLPERRYTNDWDGPWIGKSATFDEGWSAELYFPWSMVNLPQRDGTRVIGFAASRQVSSTNQRYQWPGHAYSSPQFVTALNDIRLDGVSPRRELSIIPYATATADRARDEDEARVGFDLSWRPSSSFEVTASLFPDFGAVEADDVVLNLTALETFFPEKRLFFLAGNEVFEATPRSNLGNALRLETNENFATTSRRVFMRDHLPPPIAMLNTRRIGGAATQVAVPNAFDVNPGERDLRTDLLGAAKFTGTVGDMRYGLLGAFEDDVEWFGTDEAGRPVDITADGRDFAVARLSYERSGAANRYGFGYLGTKMQGPLYHADVHGVDAHFMTGDGRWVFDLHAMRSDVDGRTGYGAVADARFAPSSRYQHTLQLDYFDEDVDLNDAGFLARNNYAEARYVMDYAFPKPRGFVKGTRGAITVRQQYNISEGQVTESALLWRNTLMIPGRNTIRTGLGYFPKRFEDVDSRGNGAYRVDDRLWARVLWTTDASRIFSWSFSAGGLQEHLGDWTLEAGMGVSVRPLDRVFMDFDVTYRRRDGWLVYQGANNFGAYHGSEWQPTVKLNWFIAPRHQVRLALQWVGVRADEQGFFAVPAGDGELIPATRTRADHDFRVSLLTAQARYRWEIAPLTDVFVVYNRGSQVREAGQDSFSGLFDDAFSDPLVDSLIIKLRYRFGG